MSANIPVLILNSLQKVEINLLGNSCSLLDVTCSRVFFYVTSFGTAHLSLLFDLQPSSDQADRVALLNPVNVQTKIKNKNKIT